MTPQRSGTPKVVGILMIIFASLGLLFGLIGLAGNSANDQTLREIPEWKTFGTVSLAFGVIGLGISALHLFAGISAVRYKANAPKLAVAYAIINIVVSVLNGILVFAWLKPALPKAAGPAAADLIGVGVLFGVIIAVIWPTIVLALMTRPAAKESCVN